MEADEDPENIILEVQLPKYLDSSLIDVDVHPKHVTIVAKNKTLRLRFPEDVSTSSLVCSISSIDELHE
jgi:protein TilB